MTKIGRILNRAGFTLIEILVTLILISLLVAAVFPVVTQQVNQADAPRLSNDLVNIRSGMELFTANLRNRLPNSLDVLVTSPVANDPEFGDRDYLATHVNRWNGPYIDAAVTANAALVSGYDATIANDFQLFDTGGTGGTEVTGATTANAEFVALTLGGLDASSFASLNDLIDGETDTATSSGFAGGKLRAITTTASAYYLAIPFVD